MMSKKITRINIDYYRSDGSGPLGPSSPTLLSILEDDISNFTTDILGLKLPKSIIAASAIAVYNEHETDNYCYISKPVRFGKSTAYYVANHYMRHVEANEKK